MPDAPSPISSLWPAENPAVTAHINLLQGIINRLANNSTSCKTWCLTLVGALISFAGATHVPGIITFAIIPVVIFGFMDTMYLAQEKAYRDLYTHVVERIRTTNYTLCDVFEARAPPGLSTVWSAIKSWSILPIYAGLIIMYVVAHLGGWLALLTAVSK